MMSPVMKEDAVAGEEEHRLGHLLGLAEAAERMRARSSVSISSCGSAASRKTFSFSGVMIVPGATALTRMPSRREVDRGLLGQRIDAALGRGIGGPALEAAQRLHRADMLTIDAAALRSRICGTAHFMTAPDQVRLVEITSFQVASSISSTTPPIAARGVVDQDVDAAPGLDRRRASAASRVGHRAHVGAHEARPAARCR